MAEAPLLVVKISNEAKHEHKAFMKASTLRASDIRGRTARQSFLSPTDLSEFYVDMTVLRTKMKSTYICLIVLFLYRNCGCFSTR